MPPNDASELMAKEQLQILEEAQGYQSLLHHPAFLRLQKLETEWLMEYLQALKGATAANGPELLRRWQIAEDWIDRKTATINQTLQMAEELRGSLSLQEALLMESISHEQKRPGNSGPGSHTTGY